MANANGVRLDWSDDDRSRRPSSPCRAFVIREAKILSHLGCGLVMVWCGHVVVWCGVCCCAIVCLWALSELCNVFFFIVNIFREMTSSPVADYGNTWQQIFLEKWLNVFVVVDFLRVTPSFITQISHGVRYKKDHGNRPTRRDTSARFGATRAPVNEVCWCWPTKCKQHQWSKVILNIIIFKSISYLEEIWNWPLFHVEDDVFYNFFKDSVFMISIRWLGLINTHSVPK